VWQQFAPVFNGFSKLIHAHQVLGAKDVDEVGGLADTKEWVYPLFLKKRTAT
jgi:hypothetical protein